MPIDPEHATEQIVAALSSAADEVFLTMLSLNVQPGAHRIETRPPTRMDGVISFVGIAGPLSGIGSISCSVPSACRIASRMLMTELTTIDDEVLDAVGEITNMVIGAFKQHLEATVGPLSMGIPTVIYGHNFTAKHLSGGSWITVPFECSDTPFEVRLFLAPQPSPEPASSTRAFVPAAG